MIGKPNFDNRLCRIATDNCISSELAVRHLAELVCGDDRRHLKQIQQQSREGDRFTGVSTSFRKKEFSGDTSSTFLLHPGRKRDIL